MKNLGHYIVRFLFQSQESTMSDPNITFRNIIEAYERIQPYVHQTPVFTSTSLNKIASEKAVLHDIELFFKCENFQKTGAFKARGATNAVLVAKEKKTNLKGMVTHSSGNHGLAVAYACSEKVGNVPCTVVVTKDTPEIKCGAIRSYGADLVFCETSPTSRKEICSKISTEKGYEIVHSSDDYHVIAGQATISYEMMEKQNFRDLDAILVSVSGGGLCSGTALCAKEINPKTKIIAVEPKGKDLGVCLQAKKRLWKNPPQFVDTIAEGIRNQQVQ